MLQPDREPDSFADQVDAQLGVLGLSIGLIHGALEAGFAAYRACTASHPVNAPGYYFYAETVSVLRSSSSALGWSPGTDGNIEYIVRSDGASRLFVLAGDGGTGLAQARLHSRRSRGARGRLAVNENQLVFDIPGPSASSVVGENSGTWALVHFIDLQAQEVRCEVSLPTSVAADGRVAGWRRRIVLPVLALGQQRIPERPSAPPIDVEVRRRASN